MHARRRSTIFLAVLAVMLFLIRWPIDEYVCNPETWHSTRYKMEDGSWVAWRPPADEGVNFFSKVFQGGGGTPAIFAMLGGQRYMVANIIWAYVDVLFHEGKIREMVMPFESVVTLNPDFTEAWSTYGWHLAWNLYYEAGNDKTSQALWLKKGTGVYLRAVKQNPKKPRHYFDVAWLYITRMGDYESALPYLQAVVESKLPNGNYKFEPVPEKYLSNPDQTEYYSEYMWVPRVMGNRLAYAYRKLGILYDDTAYLEKAIATYDRSYQLDPINNVAAKTNADDIRKNLHNPEWRAKELKQEED